MKTLYIITGGNRGLGNALVSKILFGTKDSSVLSIGRKMSDEQINLSPAQKARFNFILVDLADSATIVPKLNAKFELILNHDRIIFINNAGMIKPIINIGFLNERELMDTINVNAVAPALICNYLLRNVKGKALDFVNISTGAANKPITGWAAYCSSKAFAKMFFDVLKEEHKKNINYNIYQIDPGVMDTEMQRDIRSADPKTFPRHGEFVSLKNEGRLSDTDIAAEKILSEIKSI